MKIELNIISFIKNPLENFEYLLIPLLFRSIKLADELILSVLIKGGENDRCSFYYLIKLLFWRMDWYQKLEILKNFKRQEVYFQE
ncbi:MAG: hypothetical protein JW924_07075 [Fusobacteriaceae bacterium]|nr:hypothetical protein [Fusobacteriaceae bacterium]